MQLLMNEAQMAVQDATGPKGEPMKVVAIVDAKSGIEVIVPMDAASATRIAEGLLGRPAIMIAGPEIGW